MTRFGLGALLLSSSVFFSAIVACSSDDAGADSGVDGATADGSRPDGANVPDGAKPPVPPVGDGEWPTANTYSWDGLWVPGFPLDGLLDNEYFDGHEGNDGATPILPPGRWDWDDGNNDLANWRNFKNNLGDFEMLRDSQGNHFGWRLAGVNPSAIDYQGPAEYFEGSSGADLFNLGAGGKIHSFGSGDLRDGPDVLVFNESYSLDFRTGSSSGGHSHDNDLVVAGCESRPDGAFGVLTSTIHTGPGHDWVFVRDWSRSAIDLGMGQDGRTDSTDPFDGDDLVVIRGNAHDFRVFGGQGNDTAVWFVDEVVQKPENTWLGPNFFGGAGVDDKVWGDNGTDRLVLAVDTDTPIVTTTPTPPGSLLVKASEGIYEIDEPTVGDPFAVYCVQCGVSNEGEKTVILEYNSPDDKIHTGYFWLNSFEELQIGLGENARLYTIDAVNGTVTEAPQLERTRVPSLPDKYCSGELP